MASTRDGRFAQLQDLLKQRTQRLPMPPAEFRDGTEVRCIEPHNAHEINALLRVRCSQFGISLRRKKSPVAAVCCSGVPAECPQGTPSSLGGKRAATTLRMVTARTEIDATDEEEEHLVIRMAPPTIHLLRSRAAKKGISECALATMLLEIIVRDDLYEAVLDETSTETSRRTATLVLNPPRQS